MKFRWTNRLISLTAFILILNIAGCGPIPKRDVPYNDSVLDNNTSLQKDLKAKLTKLYKEWRGVRYRLGGNSKSGIDCSAFVYQTYKATLGISLPRTTGKQVNKGRQIKKHQLQTGDLVFFKTGIFVRHVGVYMGNGKFLHASTSKGVTQSQLDSPYWIRHYWQSRRIIK